MNTNCSLVLKSRWSLLFLLPSTKLYLSPKASCFYTLIGCPVAACVLMGKNSALHSNLVSNPRYHWRNSSAANHLSPQTSPYFLYFYIGCFFRNLLRIKKHLSQNTQRHACTHTLPIDKSHDRNSHFLVNLSPIIDHLWGSYLVQLSSPLTNFLNFFWVGKSILLENKRWYY